MPPPPPPPPNGNAPEAAVPEPVVETPPDELAVHVDEPEGTPWDPQPPLWEEEEEEEEYPEEWPPPREGTCAVEDMARRDETEPAGGQAEATDKGAASSEDDAGGGEADTEPGGGGAGGGGGGSRGNGETGGGDDGDGGDGDSDGDGEEDGPSSTAEELLSVLPDEHREAFEKAVQDENVSRLAKLTGILQGMFSRTVSTLLHVIPVPVLVSFIGVFTTYMGHRFQRYQAAESAKRKARAAEREARSRQEAEMAAFYSDFTGPLLRASAKLQERLHCIAQVKSRALVADAAVDVPGGAAADGLSVPSDEVRDPTHTAYLLARYFGVLERLKSGSQTMDFGRPAADRIFLNLVGRVQGILSASDGGLAALQRSELDFSASSGRPAPLPAGPLRVATHHQRVVGELMLRSRWFPDSPGMNVTTESTGRPGQHVALLPYDEWCKLLDTEPEMKRWMRPLVSEAWRLIHHMDPPPAVAPPPPLGDDTPVGTTAGAVRVAAAAAGGTLPAAHARGAAVSLGSGRSRLFTPFYSPRGPPSPAPTPTADPATRRNVRADVVQLPVEPVELARIFFLQDALVDLVDFLDPPPNCRFIPAARRKRLRLAGAPPRPDTPMPASLQLLYQELADVHSGHIPKRLDNHRRWGSRTLEVYVKAPVLATSAAEEGAAAPMRPPARRRGLAAEAVAADAASTSFAADNAHPGAGAALNSGGRGDCPHSQRVLMALEELRVSYTLHKVNTLVKPPWYHLLSVEGGVPLLYHEGRLVETAPQIVTYLQRRFPNAAAAKRTPLLPLALSESQLTAFARVGRDWLIGTPGVTAADLEASLMVVERVLAANARLRRGPYLGGRVLCWEDLALLPPLHHLTAGAGAVRGWTLPATLPHTAAYLAAGRRARSFVKAAPTVEAIAAGAARLIEDGPEVDADLPDIIE